MTEKTIKMIEEMKKQTIGVEIEMADIKRNEAIKVVAEHFGTVNTIKCLHDGSYDSRTCLDDKGRVWKVSRDSSIMHTADLQKSELITPILTYDDIETLQEIVRKLRRAGAKSNPWHGCGVHIHIGAFDHTPQTLKNLVNLMASHERILIDSINIAYSRISHYTAVTDKKFLDKLNKCKKLTDEKLKDLWYEQDPYCITGHYNSSRYHMLNLHAFYTKHTVEFRLFQFDNKWTDEKGKEHRGGLHAGQIKAYIQLCLAMNQLAKDSKHISYKPNPNVDNQKYAMRCWLLRLGFIGKEFETARELLTRRLTGDAAFRHGRIAA